MGGKVLMHEAEALTQSGIRKGIERGIKQGIALEKKNTELERKRADEAIIRIEEAMLEISKLKEFISENGMVYSG